MPAKQLSWAVLSERQVDAPHNACPTTWRTTDPERHVQYLTSASQLRTPAINQQRRPIRCTNAYHISCWCIYDDIRLPIVCVLRYVFAVVVHADAGVVATIDFMPLRAFQARLTSMRSDSIKCFEHSNAQCVRSTVFSWPTLAGCAPPAPSALRLTKTS